MTTSAKTSPAELRKMAACIGFADNEAGHPEIATALRSAADIIEDQAREMDASADGFNILADVLTWAAGAKEPLSDDMAELYGILERGRPRWGK